MKCNCLGPVVTDAQELGDFKLCSAVVDETAIEGRLVERHLTPAVSLRDGNKAERPPEIKLYRSVTAD